MKKIISLFVAFCICCSIMPISAFAIEASEQENNVIELQTNVEVSGYRSETLDDLFDNSPELSSISFYDFRLAKEGDCLALSGIISMDSGTITVSTTGEVYKLDGLSAIKTYLIDFVNICDLHFVQARLDIYGEAILKLLIQMDDNEEFLYFEVPIDESAVSTITNNLASENNSEKAIELYDISKNVISPVTSSMKVTGSSKSGVSISITDNCTEIPQARASYNTKVEKSEWKSFFRALRAGSVSLGDYEIDERILNTGWVFLNNSYNSSNAYSIACYTTKNGANDLIIQIMLISLIHQDANAVDKRLDMRVEDMISFTYRGVIEEFDYLRDAGPYIEDLNMGMYVTKSASSKTIFIQRTVKSNIASGTSKVIAFLAIIPYVDNVANILNFLSAGEECTLNDDDTYPDTYNEQINEYDGKVIRGIGCSSGYYTLEDVGNYLILDGKLSGGTSE